MEWLFSDGTRVQLGGNVEGAGALARKLRDQLELLPYGRACGVAVEPEPAGKVQLDPGNPYHVDAWVREWLRWVPGVELVSAPKLAALARARAESDSSRVY